MNIWLVLYTRLSLRTCGIDCFVLIFVLIFLLYAISVLTDRNFSSYIQFKVFVIQLLILILIILTQLHLHNYCVFNFSFYAILCITSCGQCLCQRYCLYCILLCCVFTIVNELCMSTYQQTEMSMSMSMSMSTVWLWICPTQTQLRMYFSSLCISLLR